MISRSLLLFFDSIFSWINFSVYIINFGLNLRHRACNSLFLLLLKFNDSHSRGIIFIIFSSKYLQYIMNIKYLSIWKINQFSKRLFNITLPYHILILIFLDLCWWFQVSLIYYVFFVKLCWCDILLFILYIFKWYLRWSMLYWWNWWF